MVFTVMVIGTLSSTSLYGFWSDWSGSYDGVLIASVVGLVCAVAIFLTFPCFAINHSDEAAAESYCGGRDGG